MKIEILDMTSEHIGGVVDVENQSFSIPWSLKSFDDELKNHLAKYFVAKIEETIAGYIGMWEISGQCDITNIAVLPEFRRKGVGRALLAHLIDYCKKNSLSPITLEVRETNSPAQQLYTTFGFEIAGLRKQYYADTGENALIFSLNIEGKER